MSQGIPDHAGHDPADDEVAPFIAKWRLREPEMAFADVFCPRGLRERFVLWGAMVHAWREAAFELSDGRVTLAKCGWWADEALRCAQSAPRHPLTIALAMPTLPWSTAARGLAAMAGEEPARPVDREDALASVAPLAEAIAAMEAALFDTPCNDDARRAVAVNLLRNHSRIGPDVVDGARIPLSLLARHGLAAKDLGAPEGEAARRDWAAELVAALPSGRMPGCLYRRARTGFDGWFLRERAAGRDRRMPPLNALFLAWRSARQVRPG